ncbi:hypothetical protein D3C81_1192260 [compost metagenome]
MRSADAVVDADTQRAAVDRHPLAIVLACDTDHVIGGAILRLVAPHEFGNHAAQVVDQPRSRVLDGPVAADRTQQDHALAKALRAVGHVLAAQTAENTVDALGEELRPAGQQAAQGSADGGFLEFRQRRQFLFAGVLVLLATLGVANLLEPLVAALLRHVVEHVGQAQRAVPEVGIQLGDRAFRAEQLVHGLRQSMALILDVAFDEVAQHPAALLLAHSGGQSGDLGAHDIVLADQAVHQVSGHRREELADVLDDLTVQGAGHRIHSSDPWRRLRPLEKGGTGCRSAITCQMRL